MGRRPRNEADDNATGRRWLLRRGRASARLDLSTVGERPRWNAGRGRGASRITGPKARPPGARNERRPAPAGCAVRRPFGPSGCRCGRGRRTGWGEREGARSDTPSPDVRATARRRCEERARRGSVRALATQSARQGPHAGPRVLPEDQPRGARGVAPAPRRPWRRPRVRGAATGGAAACLVVQAVRTRSRVARVVRSSSSTPPVTARSMFRSARPAPRTVCSWWV